MERQKGLLIIGLVVLLAASVQAQAPVPSPLPTFSLTISPTNPTSASSVNVSVSGIWPNNCIPTSINPIIEGNGIELDMTLPGASDCNAPGPVCQSTPTAFTFNTNVGPLAPGTYAVSARVSGCDGNEVASIGTFNVGLPAGGGGNGGGESNAPAPGTIVVLLRDNPNGNTALKAGMAGMVVCCEEQDCSGRLLVSFFFREAGNDTTANCNETVPTAVMPGSMVWIDPDQIPLGIRFDRCGTLGEGEEGCLQLDGDDGKTYNLLDSGWLSSFIGTAGGFDFGDRIRVRGLLSIVRPGGAIFICEEQDGDIYNPIITPCAPAGGGNGNDTGCCTAGFRPGDRVRLLINNPPDLLGFPTSGLTAGTLGTVLCCDPGDENFTVFVSWDDFTNGNNMDFFCDTRPTGTYPANSGWWMNCSSITLLAGGGNGGGPGTGCPNDNLTVSFGSSGVRLMRDPSCPTTPRSFSGCTTVTVEANFRARLSVRVTTQPGITGTWTGTVTPSIVPAGETSVQVCVNATDVDLGNIPIGQDVQVATVAILAVPAP